MKVHATTNVPYFAHATPHGWDTVQVRSKSNPNKFYTVDLTHGRCSCPAWIYSRNKADGLRPTCKHLKGLHFREIMNMPDKSEPIKSKSTQVLKEKA